MSKVSKEVETEILRLHFAEKWRVGTIATQVGVHHCVVRRVLGQAGLPVPKLRPRPSKLDTYLPFLHAQLEKYPRVPASRLFWMLKERGYDGGESRVREVVAHIRPKPKGEAFLRLSTLPGEQAQVDWAHFGKLQVGRAQRNLLAFVMVLSWSRRLFVRFFLDARMPNFLRGHVEAFDAYGGVARTLLYDNLKSAVLERFGDAIRFNPKLLEMASHYRFGPRAAAPYRGNEKGRVERAIRYIRESFFAGRKVEDLDVLNADAQNWCARVADTRRWPDDHRRTVADAFAEEKATLLPLPDNQFPCEDIVDVVARKRPYIRFDRNDYSVPHDLVQTQLVLIADDKTVRVCRGTDVVARHKRSYDKGQVIEDPEHIEALIDYKRQARRHRGIDRLRHAAPQAEDFLTRAAQRGHNLGSVTKRLLDLLDHYGAAEVAAAIAEVNKRDLVHVAAVRQLLEQQRHARGRTTPLPVPLGEPRLRDLAVRPHDLRTYDTLGDDRDDDNND